MIDWRLLRAFTGAPSCKTPLQRLPLCSVFWSFSLPRRCILNLVNLVSLGLSSSPSLVINVPIIHASRRRCTCKETGLNRKVRPGGEGLSCRSPWGNDKRLGAHQPQCLVNALFSKFQSERERILGCAGERKRGRRPTGLGLARAIKTSAGLGLTKSPSLLKLSLASSSLSDSSSSIAGAYVRLYHIKKSEF
jgi:hypothetical protein